MDLSTVHIGVHKRKRKKRVGRGIGSGHGKTASRGHKGQYASAGAGHHSDDFIPGGRRLGRWRRWLPKLSGATDAESPEHLGLREGAVSVTRSRIARHGRR